MKKVILSLILICLLALSSTISAFAADPLTLHVEGYTVNNNMINVYCSTNLQVQPAGNEISLWIGNTVLPVKEIKEFNTAAQGVSIIFLADVSGSISSSKLQYMKDTMNAIADTMSEKDNASVLTVGNEVYTQPFVSDKQKIKEQIEAIKGKPENTNLYQSIVKSLDILHTGDSLNQKKYMVILSDGEDYGIKGITREEVDKKISQVRIPVYTVAMLDAKPEDTYVQSSKILGSFARLSPGGIDYVHGLSQDSTSQIAAGIKSSIDKSLILSADLTGFKSEGNEMYMKVELNVAGQGKTSDGYSIATNGFTVSAAPDESGKDNTAGKQDEPVKEPFNLALWLIIGGSVIVLVLVIVIILKKRKKARAAHESVIEMTPVDIIPPADEQMEYSNPTIAKSEPEVIKNPDVIVRLTKVGLIEEEVYHSEIRGELIIGRDPSKSELTFPKDDLLSSKHCAVQYSSGDLILKDLGSTNGTFVNGVPISSPYKLENGDVILIGSMELRINW